MVIKEVIEDERMELKEWYEKNNSAEKNSLNFFFKTDSFFVMKNDIGHTIGIMSISAEKKYYNDIKRFILKDFRGQGFGDKFIDYLISTAKTNKIKWISGTIKSENIQAENYFLKKGFEVSDYATIEEQKFKLIKLKFE
ncbi:GNAT family N-acetyltransferase [Salinimicrobium terrae]|uniref:GNAT family N-acetyltransferase n=1 Tax=Salinimicrobium terrae TaxID=470866 RepID=UPI0003FDBEDD|nr:GNAT family N-acetyltransferase [Salinimicrobium terrae]